MGKTTGIAWTDSTWNPWMGCTKVSPGCDHCYAERDMTRYGRSFTQLTRAAAQTFYAPLKQKEPHRIFACSWSDFFHPQVPIQWREEAWNIMLSTPRHTYQVLTKRPGLMAAWSKHHSWPAHVWAGTSVENAKYLPRLDVLARVPARVRFVSAEPLLSPLELCPWLGNHICNFDDAIGAYDQHCQFCHGTGRMLDFVIVGGESGPYHRPMDVAWMQDIADQCKVAGVPVFVKQDSGPRPGMQGRIPDELWALKEMP